MEMFNRLKKVVAIMCAMAMTIVSMQGLVSIKVSADTAENVELTSEMTDAQSEAALATELEYLFTKAIKLDDDGYASQINTEAIKARYGTSDELTQLEQQLEQNAKNSENRDFVKCMKNGLRNAVGLDILKRAYTKEVRKYLKSKAWKKASSILFRNIKRVAGKKAGQFLVKKLAGKLLPGGVPAQLAWIAGKCAVKNIRW